MVENLSERVSSPNMRLGSIPIAQHSLPEVVMQCFTMYHKTNIIFLQCTRTLKEKTPKINNTDGSYKLYWPVYGKTLEWAEVACINTSQLG